MIWAFSRLLPALVTFACGSATTPTDDRVVLVEPALKSSQVSSFYSNFADTGVVVITALPSDSMFRLSSLERVQLDVTTSRSDSETVLLARHIGADFTDLSGILLTIKAGHSVNELAGTLAATGSRIWFFPTTGQTGAVRVFDPRNTQTVLSALRGHPSVALAAQDVVGVVGSPSVVLSQLLAAVALDRRPPFARNGRLEAYPGDTIFVRYRPAAAPVVGSSFQLP